MSPQYVYYYKSPTLHESITIDPTIIRPILDHLLNPSPCLVRKIDPLSSR
jgi:hypothetical protein